MESMMPTDTPVAGGAQLPGEGPAGGPQFGIEHTHLQRRLRHPVALDRSERLSDAGAVDPGLVQDHRDEESPEHVGGTVDVLGGVQRLGHRDTLAPTLAFVGDYAKEQRVARGGRAERGPERRYQGHGDMP
jgi:hypothetical protein